MSAPVSGWPGIVVGKKSMCDWLAACGALLVYLAIMLYWTWTAGAPE